MQTIPLEAIPNQEFTARVADQSFALRIKEANGVMVADVTAGGVRLLSAVRIVAGTPIIPYAYLGGAGNFVLLTDGGEMPAYEAFGVTQTLVYASAEEIAGLTE